MYQFVDKFSSLQQWIIQITWYVGDAKSILSLDRLRASSDTRILIVMRITHYKVIIVTLLCTVELLYNEIVFAAKKISQ